MLSVSALLREIVVTNKVANTNSPATSLFVGTLLVVVGLFLMCVDFLIVHRILTLPTPAGIIGWLVLTGFLIAPCLLLSIGIIASGVRKINQKYSFFSNVITRLVLLGMCWLGLSGLLLFIWGVTQMLKIRLW